MGCSKNLVDSEALLTKFEQAGYHCTHDAKRIEGEIVVVNTCGFIEDAKQESIDTILELVQAKEEGRISKLLCFFSSSIPVCSDVLFCTVFPT